MDEQERFLTIFAENVRRRSRTAKGVDDGSKTSSSKRPLLLQGEMLAERTRTNTARLAQDVWESSLVARREFRIAADIGLQHGITFQRRVETDLRRLCERWFDIATDGLIDIGAYEPDFRELDRTLARLSRTFTDMSLTYNRRYRVWTPMHTTLQLAPVLIDTAMNNMLYRSLANHFALVIMRASPEERMEAVAETQAHADLIMDGEVHPWLDGCSRVSTALVMFIASAFAAPLPLFAETKDDHHRTIRDLPAHITYFRECVSRASATYGD